MKRSVYTDENILSDIPTVSPTGYTVCLEICNGVVMSEDFTDGITEGFKLRLSYSDVVLLLMESPTEKVRR
jgi:tripartite-type tricarboxylate transporter receptor subunit TctC